MTFQPSRCSHNSNDAIAAGIVEIYLNSGNGILHNPGADIILGTETEVFLGEYVVPVGDYDGDGLNEFAFAKLFVPKLYIVGWNPSYMAESRLTIRPSWWTPSEGTIPTATVIAVAIFVGSGVGILVLRKRKSKGVGTV